MLVLFVGAPVLTSCETGPTGPELLARGEQLVRHRGWRIHGAERVSPRPMWKRQYRSVESVLDEKGNLDRVRWYVADSVRGERGVYHATAVWVEPHTIVVAEKFVDNRTVVCHECVHEILQRRGHDHRAFQACPFSP